MDDSRVSWRHEIRPWHTPCTTLIAYMVVGVSRPCGFLSDAYGSVDAYVLNELFVVAYNE